MSDEKGQSVQALGCLVEMPSPVGVGEDGRQIAVIADVLTPRGDPSDAGRLELSLRYRLIEFVFDQAADNSTGFQTDDVFAGLRLELVSVPVDDLGDIARRRDPHTQGVVVPIGHWNLTKAGLIGLEIKPCWIPAPPIIDDERHAAQRMPSLSVHHA